MKRKAISLAVCVAMILSAMTFSVSADADEAKTLLKDDFTQWYTVKDDKAFSPTVEKISGVDTFAPPAAIKKKLSTPIDFDSENVYYASWVQSMDETGSSSVYLKAGFVNFASGATQETQDGRTELVWIGDGTEIPGTKIAVQKSMNNKDDTNNKVNVGTLYNVLMKIEAHTTDKDKVSVKFWPVDSSEPLNWWGEVSETATGKREYFGIVTYIKTHFGNLNVEVYSGDKATAADKLISDAKAYVSGTADTAPNADENTDVINGGVVYNSAKNIITLKNSTYVKDIVVADANNSFGTVASIKEGGSYSLVAKIANDSNSVISDRKYFAAAASYDKYGAMQRVKLCLVDSASAAVNGGDPAKTKGLLFDNITAAEAEGYIRLYIWDAQTLAPIINGVTVDGTKMINY